MSQTVVTSAKGQCLCGAVVLTARDLRLETSACHCSQCRQWTGSAVWVLPARDVQATGPVQTFRASAFAERAFCGTCGSHLWVHDDGGTYDLCPGLFEAAQDAPLNREVYADRALACVRLAGNHAKVTAAEYEATHAHVPSNT